MAEGCRGIGSGSDFNDALDRSCGSAEERSVKGGAKLPERISVTFDPVRQRPHFFNSHDSPDFFKILDILRIPARSSL